MTLPDGRVGVVAGILRGNGADPAAYHVLTQGAGGRYELHTNLEADKVGKAQGRRQETGDRSQSADSVPLMRQKERPDSATDSAGFQLEPVTEQQLRLEAVQAATASAGVRLAVGIPDGLPKLAVRHLLEPVLTVVVVDCPVAMPDCSPAVCASRSTTAWSRI